MHSCDIVGFVHCDGFVLCDNCGDENSDEESPIFAEYIHELYGATCDQCQKYFEPLDETWVDQAYATSRHFLWAKCTDCNHQLGYNKHSRGFDKVKRLAKKNKLTCDCCRKETMQFPKRKKKVM